MQGQTICVLAKKQLMKAEIGFKQAISDPTHILKSGSSCVD